MTSVALIFSRVGGNTNLVYAPSTASGSAFIISVRDLLCVKSGGKKIWLILLMGVVTPTANPGMLMNGVTVDGTAVVVVSRLVVVVVVVVGCGVAVFINLNVEVGIGMLEGW